MPKYILNGEPIEVALEHVEIFMAQNPEAKLEEEQLIKDIAPTPGKLIGSADMTPTGEPDVMESESGDGSSVLLDRIEAGDFGEEPVEEKEEVKPSKFNNFFTEIIPTAVDNASTRIVDTSKLDIGRETVDNFMSDESFEDLHKQYPGIKFNKVGLGNGTITVKLPGQKSPRPFEVPSDDEGLGRLKFEIADYIENKQETFFKPDSNVEGEIDRIWDEHSQKWDAEDLMSEELSKLLGSDYIVETSGTLGNEFTVTKDKGKGASIDIMVGGSGRYGNNQSSDVLKRFLTQGQRSFEDAPEYYEDKKEITEIVNKNYLNNPVKLNEIFEKNNITNFSNIATPENKEALVQHILSDQNALGGILSAARTNFDNLTNIDIDEIVTGVVDSHVSNEWDAIAKKDANTELKQLKEQGYTPLQIEDIYHKQHSASFSVLENNIKNKLIEIDRADPAKKENLQLELDGLAQEYIEEGGANYDVLFDMNTGKLAPSVSDAKNENIINLKDLVQDQMANYKDLTRDELKFEFLKTAAALSEFEDKTKEIKGTGTGRYAAPFAKYNKGLFGQYQRDDYDVLLAQKAELLSKMEGLKRTYLLNERLETVNKSNLGGLVQQAGRSFVTSFGDDPNTAIINNGVTEAQTVAAIKDIYQEMNIPLNRAAREHSKTNTSDMVFEGLGGLPKVVIEFGGYGKIINGVKYLTGVNRWVQGLGMSRYKQGEKLIDESKVIKKVNKWAKKKNMDAIEGKGLNLSTTELSTIGAFVASNSNKGKKAIQIIGPSTINKAKIKAVGALTEGTVFSLVEKDIEGMPKGIAFNLAGGVIPGFNKLAPSIQKRLNSMKALYDGNAMGMRMMVGNKAGEAFNALIKDVSGHQEWQTFLKENYDDPDMIMGGLITDYVLGAALAVPHAKLLGPGGFDRMTYNKIVDAKGKFGEKLNEYIEYDANGDARIKKGKEAEFDKWNDLHTEAQRRMWELDGLADYNNPLLAPSLAKKEVKGIEKANKDILKEEGLKGIDVVWKTEGETGRRGGFVINKKTGKIEIELDPNHLTPGLVSHEMHHPLYKIAMKNKNVKAASIRKLLELTKDIKLRENLSLYNAIKDKGIASLEDMDLAKVQEAELFAYISQSIRDGAKIEGVNKSNGWARLKKWIDSSIGREISKKEARLELQTRTKNDIINWFGEYHKNIGEGGPSLAHFKKLTELVDKWTPYGKEMETTKPGEIGVKTIGSKKGDFITMDALFSSLTKGKGKGLSSQVLVDGKGSPILTKIGEKEDNTFNDKLQEIYSKPRDPKDVKKLETLKKIDSSKVAPEMKEKLEKDILDLEAGSNIYDIINSYDPAVSSNAGAARVYNAVSKRSRIPGWEVVKDDVVRDFLTGKRGIKGLTAEYNKQVKNGEINPKTFPLGKFIGGKFDVRFLESVDKFTKKEFEKSTDIEGAKEIKYEDTWMEKFETEDISPAAQIKRKKWLEDRGLTEETAESYVEVRELLEVAKELGIDRMTIAGDNVIDIAKSTLKDLDFSPKQPGESKKEFNKRVVSHKNTIDQYRKSIEKHIVTKFFNVSEAMYNKMSLVGKEGQPLKTAMAQQLNKPDLEAIRKVLETKNKDGSYKYLPTIIKAFSKGAQTVVDKTQMIDVAPDVVRGKAAGVQTVLQTKTPLYDKVPERARTSAGLAPYMQAEALLRYKRTGDATYKAEFEQNFLDLFSLNNPNASQMYKALMSQVGYSIWNQSVRSAMKAHPDFKFDKLAQQHERQLKAGISEGLASELLDGFIQKFPKFKKDWEGARNIFIDHALGDRAKIDKKYHDWIESFEVGDFANKDHASKWAAIETVGKEGRLKANIVKRGFDALEFESYTLPNGEVVTLKDIKKGVDLSANSYVKDGNTYVDVGKANRRSAHSEKFAEYLPKDLLKQLETVMTPGQAKGFLQHILGLHQRTSFLGEFRDAVFDKKSGELKRLIKDTDGNYIGEQPFTTTYDRVLKKIGINPNQAFKGLKLAFKSEKQMRDGNAKLSKMKEGVERDALRDEIFSQIHNKSRVDMYHALESAKQDYIYDAKTKKEFLSRMDWMYSIAKANSNLVQGVRQTVPVKWLYKGKLPVGDRIKLEHVKAMAAQAIETANLVASGSFKGINKDIAADFIGLTAPKTMLDVVDFSGGKLNSAGLYRMALLHPEVLMDFKSTDPNIKKNLYEVIMERAGKEIFGPKNLQKILKQQKLVEKQNLKIAKQGGLPIVKNAKPSEVLASMRIGDKALELGRKRNKKTRGASVFDFDETVGVSENFVIATKGGKTRKIASDKWPFVGDKMVKEGWKMDFSDFNKVTKGRPGPLMQKMKNQIKKYGPDNVFILTARAKESAPAIHEWLKSQGVKIPLENITGLGNSTGEAKAMWMLKKFSEGYNDMYFVDDALPNVKAVKDVLSQLDIKSKVQQALASTKLDVDINKIMEHSLDIKSEKKFSKAEAKVRGKDIKRRRIFMRDSAADLELLIEPLYGKGKKGIENKKWFKEEFIMPFERGIRDYNTARQSSKNDYMNLRKQNKDVVKQISKEVEGTTFTNDMAMRVYLWNKAGYKIPDLAKTTETKLVEHIKNNPKLQAYAEQFGKITKQEKGLKEPGENWWAETMAGEVTSMDRGVSRKKYLQEFLDVKNEIFTEANLNKMESKLGTRWRENIEDMFDRMETGRTRSLKLDRGSAAMMNYLNGGIGTIMNFNTRSAFLQTISITNFLNMRENNPIAAARAMGNVKQFSKDFLRIMNSDMLKQRRDGLSINVTEAEIASAAASSKNSIQSIISKVLKAGYTPTKLADSFAISFGGATFYRNRIKMYEKQGMETKAAEKEAFLDFQVLSERTQQSSRADLLSKQQTSLIGRFILPFANTPMQMNRAGMKDILDISKGRYKDGRELTEKVGRISYYMGAQVAIFSGLQSALFAMLLNDDDVTDEKIANTKSMMLNSTTDSMLRGFGIQGALMSGFKNATQEYFKQSAKPGFTADYSEIGEDLLNISPPLGSKFGMLDRAGDRRKWAKIRGNDKFKFELGNPSLEASLMTVQAVTNAPVYSPYQNMFNLKHAMSDQYETWQRFLMAAGWTPYSVGIETEKKKKEKEKKKVKGRTTIRRRGITR